MIPSIRGHLLPESAADFLQLVDLRKARNLKCMDCDRLFSPERVMTPAGWKETQISGFCEVCYNALFSDAEDSGVDQL
jgi:hypothetical protein